MKFEEALKQLATATVRKHAIREGWHYKLYFCPFSQQLTIKDNKADLSAYVISFFDFDYEWEICE